MSSFSTPTKKQLDAALQRMRAPEFATYFLSRLKNPNWIEGLREAGVFENPPAPIEMDDGRVSFPPWPAAEYLARMAAHASAAVASVLSDIRTRNPLVVRHIIEAGLAMPPHDAARLVPSVAEAARSGALWTGVDDASELCVHLLRGGEIQPAMELAIALFEPDSRSTDGFAKWHDRYWFEEGMKKVVPALAEADPAAWLEVLSNWLDAQIAASDEVEPDSNDDFSPWWRPAIEEHAQNLHHDLKSLLTGFLREACERAISSHQADLPDVLEVLAKHERLVFRRIQLYLIAQRGDEVPALARERMMDRRLFDDHRFKHEYAMLMEKCFPLLHAEEQEEWLSRIDAGPDLEEWVRDVREELGEEPSDEDRRNRIRYWQYEKLHWIRKHLTGERQRFFDEMLALHGEPDLADLNVRVTSGWGWGPSPFAVEELASLSFPEAVAKVSAWEPPERGFEGPTVEGLTDAFGEYVAGTAEEFSALAGVLADRPPRFIQRYLEKMREAVNAGREIDVLSVLRLCESIVRRPIPVPAEGETPSVAAARGWQWARDESSRFARAVVEAVDDGKPRYDIHTYREPIWTILDALSRDPSRSNILHDVSKDDPRTHDYLALGINSPRGTAVETALEYARWVANQIKRKEGDVEVVPDGFDAIPEVREILEWQIADGNRTVESLAVIGSRLGLVYWVDREWLGRHPDQLFDLEGIERTPRATEGWAAWNAFLVWVRPHIEFYRLFKKQFAFAVSQSSQISEQSDSHRRPMDYLAEHLTVLYARGQLGLDDDGGLLGRLLREAHPDVRRHVISFIGRVMDREQDLPEPFIGRFQALWDAYWPDPGTSDISEKPDAMTFGLWFSSGRLDTEWALERLRDFTMVAPIPEPEHAVVERLAELAPRHTGPIIHILDRTVRGDREGWHVQMSLEPARAILKVAMEAGGKARVTAERLIDHLGRRGYVELEDLLQVPRS